MISFVCFTVWLNVAASLDPKDCKPGATFSFRQGCFECWCHNGKATCSNAGSAPGIMCNFTDFDEDTGFVGQPIKKTNAAEVKPWDLDYQKPKIPVRKHVPTPYLHGYKGHRRKPKQPTPTIRKPASTRYPYQYPSHGRRKKQSMPAFETHPRYRNLYPQSQLVSSGTNTYMPQHMPWRTYANRHLSPILGRDFKKKRDS